MAYDSADGDHGFRNYRIVRKGMGSEYDEWLKACPLNDDREVDFASMG